MRRELIGAIALLALSACAVGDEVVWHLDNLERIGGHSVVVEGNPTLIDTGNGTAIEFDGVDDGIFFDIHPLVGMSTFTVEVIFKPYSGGAAEQRFFHMQEDPSQERVMFETRLVDDDLWFLDTFIYSGDQKIPLFASDNKHAVDAWYHAAIVVDGNSFNHYVDGELELSEDVRFEAQKSGRTSLGVRINKVNWFKGAIRTVRFSPRVLAPKDFLTAAD